MTNNPHDARARSHRHDRPAGGGNVLTTVMLRA